MTLFFSTQKSSKLGKKTSKITSIIKAIPFTFPTPQFHYVSGRKEVFAARAGYQRIFPSFFSALYIGEQKEKELKKPWGKNHPTGPHPTKTLCFVKPSLFPHYLVFSLSSLFSPLSHSSLFSPLSLSSLFSFLSLLTL